MAQTPLEDMAYIGGDIVAPLITRLKQDYLDKDFRTIDITRDRLPDVDLWLCRDALFHLSNCDIFDIIHNFLHSDIKFFATTHHAQCNLTVDAPSGPDTWRLVNLAKAPFYLDEPRLSLWDSIEGFPPRWLAIWARDQIVSWYNRHVDIVDRGRAFVPCTACEPNVDLGSLTAEHAADTVPGERPGPAERSVNGHNEGRSALVLSSRLNPTSVMGSDGSPDRALAEDDRGFFEVRLQNAPPFAMLSLGDCQVVRAFVRAGRRGFEPFSLRIWTSMARRSGLVLDVGAYTGIYSLLTAAVNRSAAIVAFEPHPTTYGRLISNVVANQFNGQIAPVNMAASSRSGHLDLSLHGGVYVMSSGESLEVSGHASAWAKRRVETVTADEIILGWENFHPSELTLALPRVPVSLVKIDVEGHERATLSGMRRIIERDQPAMLVEILEPNSLPELLSRLPGYEAFWVNEEGGISKSHVEGALNVLFVASHRTDLKDAIAGDLGIDVPK